MDSALKPRDLNEQDWRFLYSLGAANRFVPVTEIQQKNCLINALKMRNYGYAEVISFGEKAKTAHYGLTQNGLDLLLANPQYKPKEDKGYLFGITAKDPIPKTRTLV